MKLVSLTILFTLVMAFHAEEAPKASLSFTGAKKVKVSADVVDKTAATITSTPNLRAEQQKSPAGAHTLVYRGGPVIPNVEIQPIYIGAVRVKSELHSFYKALVTGPFMKFLTQYNTPTQKIGEGKTLDPVHVPEKFGGGLPAITQAEIQEKLMHLIDNGKVPHPSKNVLYSFHFEPGVMIEWGDKSWSCNAGKPSGSWCGIHGGIIYTDPKTPANPDPKNVDFAYFAVQPDYSREFSPGCFNGCGGAANTEIDIATYTVSHEVAEAITDPAVFYFDPYKGSLLGWYNDPDGEVGDYCNGQNTPAVLGDGKSYMVQKLWSNTADACVVPV